MGTNDNMIATDTALLSYRYFCVYTQSILVEQATPASHLLFDAFSSVSAIEFTDKDQDEAEMGGTITWRMPARDAERVHDLRMYPWGSSKSPVQYCTCVPVLQSTRAPEHRFSVLF